ncbi:MAG: hypothetical protein M3454_03710 [Actinomycetota bacterium]|nr:hypothetical protein [Actinomycetota bacterium]
MDLASVATRAIGRGRSRAGIAQLISDNTLFAALFAVGGVLRAVVFFTYQPALLLQLDTLAYLSQASGGSPSGFRPFLYPVFIKPALALNNLALVPLIQHVLGLTIGLLLYVLMRRLGAGPTPAALGTAPILLDGYQLIIEQYVLTEALFDTLVVSAVALLLWRARPSPAALATAGALVAMSGLTRFVGLALIAPFLLYVVIRRLGLLRLCCLLLGFILPLVVYGTWFQTAQGSAGVSNRNGFFLYGRIASFASCEGVDVPPSQTALCIEEPPQQGFVPTGFWSLDLPKKVTNSPRANQILLSFSRRMILAKPLEYAGAVGYDFLRFFAPRSPPSQEPNVARWRFPRTLEDADPRPRVRRLRGSAPPELGVAEFHIAAAPAAALRLYQGVVYTYGPLLGALLVAGLAGSWASRSRWREQKGSACLLFSLLGAVILLAPVMTTVYHFRYVLPALPLLGPAGILGATQLSRRRGAHSVNGRDFSFATRRSSSR